MLSIGWVIWDRKHGTLGRTGGSFAGVRAKVYSSYGQARGSLAKSNLATGPRDRLDRFDVVEAFIELPPE